jgi:hypothetical protein
MRTTSDDLSPKALLFFMAPLLFSLVGSCVGFVFGLSVPLPVERAGALYLWVLGWTTIGSIQGACVAPAYQLGHGRPPALRPFSALLLLSGAMATSLLALSLWQVLGHSGRLSLTLAGGLLFMCAAPLSAYLFARREPAPVLPVCL